MNGSSHRDAALAFLGEVTASVTHELNNVFAVLGQVAGLLRDHLAGAGEGRPAPEELLRRVEERMTRNLDRGVEIVRRLNRFAHSADEPRRTLPLREVLSDVVALARRLAERDGKKLEEEYPEAELHASGDPVSLLLVVFRCLRAVAQAAAGASVRIRLERREGGALVSMGDAGPLDPDLVADLRAQLTAPLEAWKASLVARDEWLDLRLPEVSS